MGKDHMFRSFFRNFYVCYIHNQLPQTISDNIVYHTQLDNELWWQLPYFSNIYQIVMKRESVSLCFYDELLKS